MRLLINCVPLKRGGGLRVGRTFIQALREVELLPFSSVVVASGRNVLDNQSRDSIISCRSMSAVALPGSRWKQELGLARLISLYAPAVVYTPFGPPPLFNISNWHGPPNLVGCAYSNLFYRDIQFWRGLSRRSRLTAFVKDRLRLWSTLRSDIIVFESDGLRQRAARMFPRRHDSFITIRPSVNPDLLLGHEERRFPTARASRHTVLMLSGYHPNKNWQVLPEIAAEIEKENPTSGLRFALCESADNPGVARIMSLAQEYGVAERITAIGPVGHSDLLGELSSATAVMLLSELESFSNNLLEAWATRTPIVLADRPWARSEAGEAALYCEPRRPTEVAQRLLLLESLSGPELAMLVHEGERRLLRYPSAAVRARQVLDACAELANPQRCSSFS